MKTLTKIGIGVLAMVAACGISFAAGKNTSEYIDTNWYGLIFDDGVVVMVYYPDENETPRTMNDVSSRFKRAWDFVKTTYK